MIVLLLVTAVEAYLIQSDASQQGLEIYRPYVKDGETLYRMRRALFLGSIAARDFFLSPQVAAEELIPAIRQAYQGKRFFSPTVAERMRRARSSLPAS